MTAGRRNFRAGWAILLAALAAASQADVDNSLYEVERRLSRPQEQQRYRVDIAREQAEAAAAERARQAVLTEAAEARRRADLARPWPERLTEQRCTVCHPAVNYTRVAHALPGWASVVLRMRVVNAAPVSVSETLTIVRHLADTYPATGMDAGLEWAACFGIPSLPWIFWSGMRWAQRLRRRC